MRFSNPSPGPALRDHPLPKGEGWDIPKFCSPLPWGEGGERREPGEGPHRTFLAAPRRELDLRARQENYFKTSSSPTIGTKRTGSSFSSSNPRDVRRTRTSS